MGQDMARTRDEALHKRRKSEILDAAAKCFAEKGIHQTSMQEICEAAKISAGALYRYFDSKRAIIFALAESEKTANDALIAHLVGARDIVEALCEALPSVLEILCDEEYGRLAIEIAAEASRNQVIAQLFGQNEEELRQALSAALAEGQKLGTVDPKISADSTAFMILALFDGITGRSLGDKIPSRRLIVKTMRHFLRRSLRPKITRG